jgi:hypothetical protein
MDFRAKEGDEKENRERNKRSGNGSGGMALGIPPHLSAPILPPTYVVVVLRINLLIQSSKQRERLAITPATPNISKYSWVILA